MKKYDPVLYAALAVIFAASCAFAYLPGRPGGSLTVEVTRDGAPALSKRLDRLAGSVLTFGEPGAGGNFNEISIGGGVRMTSADCPGGDCLRAGEIRRAGEVIVCVPHKLIVKLTSATPAEIDALSY
jgi:hypothetical protein